MHLNCGIYSVLDSNELRTLAAVVQGQPPEPNEVEAVRRCLAGEDPEAETAAGDSTSASGEAIPVAAFSFDQFLRCKVVLEGISQHGRTLPVYVPTLKKQFGPRSEPPMQSPATCTCTQVQSWAALCVGRFHQKYGDGFTSVH